MRVVRALRYDYAMPDAERARLGVKVLWQPYLHDRADLNCQIENAAHLKEVARQMARVRSWISKAAADDYLTVMGWVTRMLRCGLAPKRMRRSRTGRNLPTLDFMRRVAFGDSMRSIGEADGTNETGADRRWAGIVETLHAIANGQETRLAGPGNGLLIAGRVNGDRVQRGGK